MWTHLICTVISSTSWLPDAHLRLSSGKRSHRYRYIEPKEEYISMASQMVLVVKNLPENAGDAGNLGSILGSKDPLEKKIAAHSTVLAGKSCGQRSWAGYSPRGHKSQTCSNTHMRTRSHIHTHTLKSLSCILATDITLQIILQ